MKYNRFLMLILILLVIFVGVDNIYANSYTLNRTDNPEIGFDGVHVYNKKLGNDLAYCISGVDVGVAASGTTCNINNTLYAEEQRVIIGTIINQECDLGNEGACYLGKELTIAKYLGKSISSENSTPGQTLKDYIDTKLGEVNESLNKRIYDASNFKIDFLSNERSVQNLIFTREGDFYKSQNISISLDNLSYIDGNLGKKVSGVNGAVVEASGSTFYIKVPVANVTGPTTIELTASANQQNYYVSDLYSCATGTQDLALSKTKQRTATKTISGVIVPTGKLIINKYDDDGKTKLQGANLKLVDKDGNTINECSDERGKSYLCKWTTTKSDKIIEGLPAGTYYLVEESAPKGYDLTNTKIEIIISESGKVIIDGEESSDGEIKFYNSLTRTEINKINGSDGKSLSGSTLEVLDSEENSISCTILENNGKNKVLDKCTWISGTEKTIIKGLPAGTYYLIETLAPEGYELNTDKIKFEVKADGTTTEVKIENNLIVKVPDTLSSRSILLIAISMFDIALGIGILTYVKKNKIQE